MSDISLLQGTVYLNIDYLVTNVSVYHAMISLVTFTMSCLYDSWWFVKEKSYNLI